MSFVLYPLWFLIFLKLLLFWLWLWQLKEYHLGRLKAHFESQAFKKIISSLWRPKYPKFTKKIIAIFLSCLAVEIFFLFSFPLLWVIILTIFFIPLLILSFQIPSRIWREIIIQKAKEKRKKFKDLIVIGITGSYGKTSTKEFLATILSEKFKVLKTKGHQNSEVGISQSILNDLKPDHQIFIVEMGAYNRGGVKLLCDIVKPKIGIVTGVNEQHLATFGSMENLLSAEGGEELIKSLPENGLAIFNGDNNYCYELYKKTFIPKRVYSFQSTIGALPSDLYISSLAVNRDFLSFKVLDKEGREAIFKVNLLGDQNVSNILAATCVAKELGMSLEEISQAAKKIESWQSGIQLKKGIKGLNIIDATYSANPDGVLSHLEYLKIWPQKKIIIMPSLIELGQASKRIHRELGEKIAEVCDLAIITTKDRFKEIKEEAGQKAIFIENPKEIFERIKAFCQPGDTILLEGRVPQQLLNLLIKEQSI